jgi:hypothetical protein
VSVGSDGTEANVYSDADAISADGRFVVFDSGASNLVAGDTNQRVDVFVRDRVAGTTERVSVGSGRTEANDNSLGGAISADGRFVVFDSEASNLVAGDTNGRFDVFVRDREAGTTTLISAAGRFPPRAGKLLLTPWPPRAGGRLSAAMPVSMGGAPTAGARVSCAATLAGHTLGARGRSFRAGRAQCVWTIPPNAHGERLNGSLAATIASDTIRRHFTSTVR